MDERRYVKDQGRWALRQSATHTSIRAHTVQHVTTGPNPEKRASTWSLPGTADDYDARWRQMAASGENPHGEADLICRFEPASVLDGGCGTGRVAIELAHRGIDVVGVDVDAAMLAAARSKAPTITWVESDLAAVSLEPRFDVIALPGNVMIFVTPGREGAVVSNLGAHLAEGGRLIAGFQLRRNGLDLHTYDQLCAAAGLTLEHRWATWDCAPYTGGYYAVSVHARAGLERSGAVG